MYPVFHSPGLSGQLMSISEWLKNSYTLEATEDIMSIQKKTGKDALSLFPDCLEIPSSGSAAPLLRKVCKSSPYPLFIVLTTILFTIVWVTYPMTY